jgi:hypothetical protein
MGRVKGWLIQQMNDVGTMEIEIEDSVVADCTECPWDYEAETEAEARSALMSHALRTAHSEGNLIIF